MLFGLLTVRGKFVVKQDYSHMSSAAILEVGVTSHAQIRHIVLGCQASFSLFIMLNLYACNVCENCRTITKFS